LFSISACNKSVDTQEELDLSQITVTGTQGPDDFIGNIDLSDWDPSSYSAIAFGKSFWIQKYSPNDTLYFGGVNSGDSINQSLKIYNWGNTNLTVKLQVNNPFFTAFDSIEIQPSMLGLINIYFILPDTNNVYYSTLTLRCSTQDSVTLKLKGYRVSNGSGIVVDSLPNYFSLAPAHPNPTDGEIRFSFIAPERIDAVLKVVNKRNEVVATIAYIFITVISIVFFDYWWI